MIVDGPTQLLVAVDGETVIPLEDNGALPPDGPLDVATFRERLRGEHEGMALIPQSAITLLCLAGAVSLIVVVLLLAKVAERAGRRRTGT